MSTSKAVIQYEKNGPMILKEIERHKPEKDEVLIRVHAVATNPVDYKVRRAGYFINGKYPFIFGEDVSGTIEEVGDGVTVLKKGDPVFAWLDSYTYLNYREGGFQEYTIAKVAYTAMKPSKYSFEEATCIGLPAMTAAVGLYSKFDLQLPFPSSLKPNKTDSLPVFFVNGGSTAVGSAAVQFAILSGFRVIATSSPKNFDFLKSLGVAEADCFDYNDKDIVQKVKAAAGKDIEYAYDSNSSELSIRQAVEILNKKGNLVTVLNPPADLNAETKVCHVFTNNIIKDEKLTEWYIPFLRSLAEDDQFIFNKPVVVGKGLSAEEVTKVLDYAESGQLSASRAVLQII